MACNAARLCAHRGRRRQNDGRPALVEGAVEHAGETRQGTTIPQVCQTLDCSEQTFCRWRTEYGALKDDEAHRLKAFEQENARSLPIVAGQALDISMLRDLSRGTV
jgi:putative transposase